MADIWPENTPDFELTLAMFEKPFTNLMYGVILGVVMIVVLIRFLPRSMVRGQLVLNREIEGNALSDSFAEDEADLVGKEGVAVSDLHPVGEIEIDGRWLEARSTGQIIDKGSRVRILRRTQFEFEVEELES